MITSMEKLQQLLARGTGHKRLDDDLFKAVDSSFKIYRRDGIFDIEELPSEPEKTDNFLCNVNGCMISFSSMAAYDSHYNSNHRYTCIYCRKLLQSAHLLDLHLSEMHDNYFLASSAKKPMFKCLIETCQVQFWNSNERNDHCIEIHKMSKSCLLHFGNKKNKKQSKPKKAASSKGLVTVPDLSMESMVID